MARRSGPFCTGCGEPLTACAGCGLLDPPHYCATCGRWMAVAVSPRGWTARCPEHGAITSTDRVNPTPG
jgi:hypothetical protein